MFTTSRRRGRDLGFTLVELLVVISVIVVLMGMVLPVLQQSGARAREVKCLSNIGQIAKAIITYSGNFDGFLPSPAHSDTFPSNAETVENLNGGATVGNQKDPLFDGHKESGVYKSYTWKGKIIYYVGTVSLDEDELYALYKCPSARDFRGHQSFYGTNAFLSMHAAPERVREVEGDVLTSLKLAHYDDIPETARTYLVGENNDGHWVVKPKLAPIHAPPYFTPVTPADSDWVGQVYEGEIYARHAKRSSWVYCDGHVEPVRYSDVHQNACFFWKVDKH